jgi:hypothetical protein
MGRKGCRELLFPEYFRDAIRNRVGVVCGSYSGAMIGVKSNPGSNGGDSSGWRDLQGRNGLKVGNFDERGGPLVDFALSSTIHSDWFLKILSSEVLSLA